MAATNPARPVEAPPRPGEAPPTPPSVPRPGRWSRATNDLADPSATLTAVRAELAQLRALLDE